MGIAIGNVLGSNVFNILGILGVTGLVCPMQLQGITNTDLSIIGHFNDNDLVLLIHQIRQSNGWEGFIT